MFTVLKEKNFPSGILNQVKMYFRDKGEIKKDIVIRKTDKHTSVLEIILYLLRFKENVLRIG